ncbi:MULTISPECIES: hypothetical protein [Mycobacterium avium complex (MAC)]|nr:MULTISPECIES: hypothetical protein [Mycobacterium avium complex (MAC)]
MGYQIDLSQVPVEHKGEPRSGWYQHPSGVYISPLVVAKHRMTGEPPQAFTYEAWRHGGWYVAETVWPNGGCGCVSRNYADGKWRIACDPRPFGEQPTFRTREDAARGEWLFVKALVEATPW